VEAADGTTEPTTRAARGQAAREGFQYCLKVFVGVRVGLALIALLGVALLPDFSHVGAGARAALPLIPHPVSVPGWPAHPISPGWHNLFTAW